MFAALKNHPFAVEAFFESSLVLTYAVPKEQLETIIPECLQLDTLNDQWGFVAAAFVKTKNLRPKGFPQFTGNDFILAGYRVFVRYTTSYGKRLRGLYILRSETDKRKMTFLGNVFTHYQYTTTDIVVDTDGARMKVCSSKSGVEIEACWKQQEIKLPPGSPFTDWKEARRFAGPLPFTFTYNREKKEVLIIEGVRENWTPQPVHVVKEDVAFIRQLNLKDVVLANAFLVQDISYFWKKGNIDKWKS